jgi:hypothetical protein
MALGHLDAPNQGPYTLVEGNITDEVTGVALVLSDGTVVQTSITSGTFVAWWPGSDDPTSAQITTASGTTTEAVNNVLPVGDGGN